MLSTPIPLQDGEVVYSEEIDLLPLINATVEYEEEPLNNFINSENTTTAKTENEIINDIFAVPEYPMTLREIVKSGFE